MTWFRKRRAPVERDMRWDMVRIKAYQEGAEDMKNVILERLTWFADTPNVALADYVWRIITDTRQQNPRNYPDRV